MLRLLACVLLLAVAGCATTVQKEPRAVVASSITKQVSPELECLSDCLGEGDTNGEMCVERCID